MSAVARIKNVIASVDRNKANVEAEKGETIVTTLFGVTLPEHYRIEGKKHKDGGTTLSVPEGSFVFSDTKEMEIKDERILSLFNEKKPKTPAEIAKKYDLNKYKGALVDPETSTLDKVTASLMLKNNYEKLALLALYQESMKGFREGIPDFARPFMESVDLNIEVFQKIKEGENPEAGEKKVTGGTVEEMLPEDAGTIDPVQLARRIATKMAEREKTGTGDTSFTYHIPHYLQNNPGFIESLRGELRNVGLDLEGVEGLMPKEGNPWSKIVVKRTTPAELPEVDVAAGQEPVQPDTLESRTDLTNLIPQVDISGADVRVSPANTEAAGIVQNAVQTAKVIPDAAAAAGAGAVQAGQLAGALKDISGALGAAGMAMTGAPMVPLQAAVAASDKKQKGPPGLIKKLGELGSDLLSSYTYTIGGPDQMVNLKASSLAASRFLQDEANARRQMKLSADAVYLPVKGVDRGDYSAAGTTYGQFRPGEQQIKYTEALPPLITRKGGSVLYDYVKKYTEGGTTEEEDKRKAAGAATAATPAPGTVLGVDPATGRPLWDPQAYATRFLRREGITSPALGINVERSALTPEAERFAEAQDLPKKPLEQEKKMQPEAKKEEAQPGTDGGKDKEEAGKEQPFRLKAPYSFSSQDVRNIAGAIAQLAGIKKFLPWSAPVDYYVPRAVYYDPAREIQAAATVAATQARGMSTFLPAQVAAANLAEQQARLATQAADIVSQAGQRNIGIAGQMEQQKASIYNQAAAMERARQQQLYDQTVTAQQQYDDATRKALAGYIATLNQAEKNAALMYNLSNFVMSGSPYYYDPVTGVMKYDPERGKISKDKTPPKSEVERLGEIMQKAREMGLSEDKAYDFALRSMGYLTGKGATPAKKKQTSGKKDNDDDGFKVVREGDRTLFVPKTAPDEEGETGKETDEIGTRKFGGKIYSYLKGKRKC